MGWFLVAGCIGVVMAGVMTLGRDHVPSHLLMALWPTSLTGMAFTEPPKLSLSAAVLILIMYGGNFVLYGLVGGVVKYILGRGWRY